MYKPLITIFFLFSFSLTQAQLPLIRKETPKAIPKKVPAVIKIKVPIKGFEKRRREVVQTITITQPTFHLDFYDNGEIDGDSITVFFNGNAVLSHKRLSDKPISLDLIFDKNVKENIVTMYADNLGEIPPNTATVIVTSGGKQYQARLVSDYGKSASLTFLLENK